MSLPSLRVIRATNRSPMTLDGTRTFLIGEQRPVVIDPGPDDPRHVEALLEALDGRRPAAILLTHGHADHAGAAPVLARHTAAPVRMGRGAVNLPEGLEIRDHLEEGTLVRTDAGEIRAVRTPGHAPEHMAFFWTEDGAPAGGALFVGDLLMGSGDTTLVAPPEGDLRDYLGSLERVEAIGASVLFPTHGEPILDPAGAVARYRRHRESRLEQVRSILRHDPTAGVDQLVEIVYGASLDPELRGAAAGSVRAMLAYLEQRDPIDPSR